MPLKFWDEAFLTATFLINMLPSKVLQFETPVERLLQIKPNYESLRIFGWANRPNLCPYNKHFLFDLNSVFFLATIPYTKVTSVFTYPQIVFIFPVTSCLMSLFFLSLTIRPIPHLQHHPPLLYPLTNLLMMHILHCC